MLMNGRMKLCTYVAGYKLYILDPDPTRNFIVVGPWLDWGHYAILESWSKMSKTKGGLIGDLLFKVCF